LFISHAASISVVSSCTSITANDVNNFGYVFFQGLTSPGQVRAAPSRFYCFRNENFAFFDLSGKARVDPKTFRLSCSETSAWRGAFSGVSQSDSLFTKTFLRLTEKKLNKMAHFYSNDLCDVDDAMRCLYLLQQR